MIHLPGSIASTVSSSRADVRRQGPDALDAVALDDERVVA